MGYDNSFASSARLLKQLVEWLIAYIISPHGLIPIYGLAEQALRERPNGSSLAPWYSFLKSLGTRVRVDERKVEPSPSEFSTPRLPLFVKGGR